MKTSIKIFTDNGRNVHDRLAAFKVKMKHNKGEYTEEFIRYIIGKYNENTGFVEDFSHPYPEKIFISGDRVLEVKLIGEKTIKRIIEECT